MSSGDLAIEDKISELKQLVSGLGYPTGFQTYMSLASVMVEQAAFSIKDITPGNRVAELLLLAARLEEMSGAPDESS